MNILNNLTKIGNLPDDSDEEKLSKKLLILLALFMSVGGLVWGSICLYFNLLIPMIIPFGYVVLSIINLYLFYFFKNFNLARFIQVFISLLLPFIFQYALGGFFPSGGVQLWSLLSLVGSISFQSIKNSIKWLLVYIILTIVSFFINREVPKYGVIITENLSIIFFYINFSLISSIVTCLVLFFVHGRDVAVFTLKKIKLNLEVEKNKVEKALHDLQTTQTQLIEAERMASLGQLVGGVAHEINNPISVIRSNSELINTNLNSMLREVPHYLESLSESEKEVFYNIINTSIGNKEFLTTKEERARKKEIKKEIEELISGTPEKIDYITEQILLLKLKSPFKNYINNLGISKFIESLTIAQIIVNQSNSIGNIEIAVEKATRVVFALRSYLNTEMFFEKKEVDLVQEIEKALHLYDNYIMGKINIYKDYPKDLYFTCTSETISQVWKNLIFNTIQSMYLTEKKLEIRLEKLETLPEKVKSMKSSLLLEEEASHSLYQSWIVFSITDSGEGINPINQDKIFTPFFTTKALGEGIGLGLYVSRKIVHDHGGRIYFESREGRTEFIVALPLS